MNLCKIGCAKEILWEKTAVNKVYVTGEGKAEFIESQAFVRVGLESRRSYGRHCQILASGKYSLIVIPSSEDI